MFAFESNIYICGGVNKYGKYNVDIHKFDISKSKWSTYDVKNSECLLPRTHHSTVTVKFKK